MTKARMFLVTTIACIWIRFFTFKFEQVGKKMIYQAHHQMMVYAFFLWY